MEIEVIHQTALANLCVYDKRSPYYIEPLYDHTLRDGCACDKCYRGNNSLSLIILAMLDVVEATKSTFERQTDYQARWAMEDIGKALNKLEKL